MLKHAYTYICISICPSHECALLILTEESVQLEIGCCVREIKFKILDLLNNFSKNKKIKNGKS